MNIAVVDQISSALSFASLKNQVIASNIANRDTPGYQRLKAEFDHAWASSMQGPLNVGSTGGAVIAAGRSVAIESGPAASLEEDLVALSGNAMNYQALSRVLSRYFSIAQVIANGGRI